MKETKKIKKIMSILDDIRTLIDRVYTIELFPDGGCFLKHNSKIVFPFESIDEAYKYLKMFYENQISKISITELKG